MIKKLIFINFFSALSLAAGPGTGGVVGNGGDPSLINYNYISSSNYTFLGECVEFKQSESWVKEKVCSQIYEFSKSSSNVLSFQLTKLYIECCHNP